MLTAGILETYRSGIDALGKQEGAELVGVGAEGAGPCGQAYVYTVSGRHFRSNRAFEQEVFGPSSIIVRCADMDEVAAILQGMEGQLTATLHMAQSDHEAAARLVPILEQRAGRIIANAWPTGVDVTHAMVHGGPFPATSDGRSTSVERWCKTASCGRSPIRHARGVAECAEDDRTGNPGRRQMAPP